MQPLVLPSLCVRLLAVLAVGMHSNLLFSNSSRTEHPKVKLKSNRTSRFKLQTELNFFGNFKLTKKETVSRRKKQFEKKFCYKFFNIFVRKCKNLPFLNKKKKFANFFFERRTSSNFYFTIQKLKLSNSN